MTPRNAVAWFRLGALASCLALGIGCGDDTTPGGKDGGAVADAAADSGGGSGKDATVEDAAMPGDCPAPAPNQPPESLSCTGLYGDIAAKKLASGVSEFAPAVALWSDGAEKTRWVSLPAGEKIDVTDADSWRFPLGTKFWKEFKWKGKRVETRMFWKVSKTFWARTAYKWNDAETEATRSGGEDLDLGGDTYHIPSTTECDQCHKGRVDRALGFEAILLGLPGATGMTLDELKSADRFTGGTVPSSVEIGDDGTGHAADALGFLHVNCGVSCHNGNPAAEAYSTGVRLAVKVSDADGRPSDGFDAIATTVGVDAVTGRWLGRKRITAGSAADSLLYSLMSTRNPTNMKDQMPPIASRIVPKEGAAILKAWIDAMGGGGGQDAGAN